MQSLAVSLTTDSDDAAVSVVVNSMVTVPGSGSLKLTATITAAANIVTEITVKVRVTVKLFCFEWTIEICVTVRICVS